MAVSGLQSPGKSVLESTGDRHLSLHTGTDENGTYPRGAGRAV